MNGIFFFIFVGVFLLINGKDVRRIWVESRRGELRSLKDMITDYEASLARNVDVSFAEQVLLIEMPFISRWAEQKRYKLFYRTIQIRKSKQFRGAEGFEVAPEHEILISATLARLTLGLSRNYNLPKFELIEVYPREFYSKLLEQYVKGLTLGNGRLFLSWTHFEHGHDDPSDKLHLGLHEFAHAMMIQFDRFHFNPYWDDWQVVAVPIMQSVSLSGNHFFRRYGATNIHEFWAVSVETFFEQPREFQMNYPELFRHTCRMLNQWPGEG